MNQDSCVIGVLGGMGTFATIHLFMQYAQIFRADKEWDRPRIIIDNRCTLPSRVRAALYGEKRLQLVNEMSESVRNLIDCGCTRIILACNTSHLFLPDIYDRVPQAEGKIKNIIEICADGLCKDEVHEVFLLASEGTIDNGIYQEALKTRNIECIVPEKEEYSLLRDCIEAVKQDQYTDRIRQEFIDMIHRGKVCVLGCTELPILYEKYFGLCSDVKVYDPVLMTLTQIHNEFIEG